MTKYLFCNSPPEQEHKDNLDAVKETLNWLGLGLENGHG